MAGWIKLHRTLKDWEWYDDHNATRLLIHLLINVNYEDKKWRGILIPAGSIVTSWENLSEDSKLSVRQCRTAMNKLETSGETTRVVTSKFQLISLVKWGELQSDDRQATADTTGERQAGDKQATTTKEVKEIKEGIEERMAEFKNSLQPFLETYGSSTLNSFYLYWTEKKPNGKKMRFEMEKVFDISRRLGTWKRNERPSLEKKDTVNRQTVDIIKNNASGWVSPE